MARILNKQQPSTKQSKKKLKNIPIDKTVVILKFEKGHTKTGPPPSQGYTLTPPKLRAFNYLLNIDQIFFCADWMWHFKVMSVSKWQLF
jgi:hypothetical protein